jgi:Domain of unknown function (DUF4304)
VTAQDELKVAMRTLVGPWLRSRGFKGSGNTWRLKSDRGDFAIVNVQTSQFSTRDELTFAVNMAVAPEPWLSWNAFRTYPGTDPKYLLRPNPSKPRAEGVWAGRLQPGGNKPGSEWWIVSDESTAIAAANDVILQLDRAGLPWLRRLLDREAITELVRTSDGDGFWCNRYLTLAVLLSDEGPSDDLDQALVAANDPESPIGAHTQDELQAWSRERLTQRPGAGV